MTRQIEHLYNEAEEKRKHQQLDDAIKLYKSILIKDQTHVGAWCGLSASFREQGKFESSEAVLAEAFSLNIPQYWLNIEAALLAREQGNIDSAIHYCEIARDSSPANEAAYLWLHTFWAAKNDIDALRKNKEAAALKLPKFDEIESHFTIHSGQNHASDMSDLSTVEKAQRLFDEGKKNEAIECLQARTSVSQNDIHAWIRLTDILALSGRHNDASIALEQALTLNGNNEWLLLQRPHLYSLAGMSEQAHQMYLQLSSKLPHNPLPLIRISQEHIARGEYENAYQAAESAIKIEPGNYWALQVLAKSLQLLNKPMDASAVAEKLISLYPSDPVGYLLCSELHSKTGESGKRRTYLLEALNKVKDKAVILPEALRVFCEELDYEGAFILIQNHIDALKKLHEISNGTYSELLQIFLRISPTSENHEILATLFIETVSSSNKKADLSLACHLLIGQVLVDILRVPIGGIEWPRQNEQTEAIGRLCLKNGIDLLHTLSTALVTMPQYQKAIEERARMALIPAIEAILESGEGTKESFALLVYFRRHFHTARYEHYVETHHHLMSELTYDDWMLCLQFTRVMTDEEDPTLSALLPYFPQSIAPPYSPSDMLVPLIITTSIRPELRENVVANLSSVFSSEDFSRRLPELLASSEGPAARLIALYLASSSSSISLPRKLLREIAVALPHATRRLRLFSSSNTRIIGDEPKVAFCVSGQIRNLSKIRDNWEEFLFPGCRPEVFVHVWDRLQAKPPDHYSFAEVFPHHACQKLLDLWHLDHGVKIWQIYPSLYAYISTPQSVPSHTELSRIFMTDVEKVVIEDESIARFAHWTNQQKQAHKIRAADSLMKSFGNEYDLVVRMRPDVLFTRKPRFSWKKYAEMLSKDFQIATKFSAYISQGEFVSDDSFAIGNPNVMSLYANYSVLQQSMLATNVRWRAEIAGHQSIGNTLWFYGIKSVVVDGLKPEFVRNCAPMPPETLRNLILQDAAGRMTKGDEALLSAIHQDILNSA